MQYDEKEWICPSAGIFRDGSNIVRGEKKWDMVLLDLMLPGMDGEEVLRKIRGHHHVPVLIISAKGEQQTKINGLRAGADDFITKPFDIEEVMARINA